VAYSADGSPGREDAGVKEVVMHTPRVTARCSNPEQGVPRRPRRASWAASRFETIRPSTPAAPGAPSMTRLWFALPKATTPSRARPAKRQSYRARHNRWAAIEAVTGRTRLNHARTMRGRDRDCWPVPSSPRPCGPRTRSRGASRSRRSWCISTPPSQATLPFRGQLAGRWT
jgi:hypothetical protein